MRQEAGELVDQDVLNLVGLLDLYGHPDRVDGRLDEHPLVLVTGDRQGRQQHLGGALGLDLGDVVSLGCLGGEVAEGEACRQAASDCLEVGAE